MRVKTPPYGLRGFALLYRARNETYGFIASSRLIISVLLQWDMWEVRGCGVVREACWTS